VADEALQGEKWAKFFITQSVDGRVLTEMIQYLKEHKIDVVPYPEMELYRK